jgi:hypothetical protein
VIINPVISLLYEPMTSFYEAPPYLCFVLRGIRKKSLSCIDI